MNTYNVGKYFDRLQRAVCCVNAETIFRCSFELPSDEHLKTAFN